MVIIPQLAPVNQPINKEIGGLEDTNIDRPKKHQQDKFKEMFPKEILHPRAFISKEITSTSCLVEAVI